MKKVLWVGIDVSKQWIDAALINEQGDLVGSIQRYGNNYEDFARLILELRKQVQTVAKQVMFGFENTGRYSRMLRAFLDEYSYSYTEIPGLEIKRSSGIERGKTDNSDALKIARYIFRRKEEIAASQPIDKALIELGDLLAYRRRLQKIKHSLEVSVKEIRDTDMTSVSRFIDQQSSKISDDVDAQNHFGQWPN